MSFFRIIQGLFNDRALLFRMIQGLYNDKLMGESIVDLQVRAYQSLKRADPHLEEHELLAMVWLERRKALERLSRAKTDDNALNLLSLTETHRFSVLDYPSSIRALGLYTVHRESPDTFEKHPEFSSEYERLIEPVCQSEQAGTFLEWYKRKNPKLAVQMGSRDADANHLHGCCPPQERVALDSKHAVCFPMRDPWPVAYYLKRFAELALAALLAGICALTIWVCWYLLGHPPENAPPRSTALQIALVLGFIASAGLLFAARLAFPLLRVEGGHIIGVQGVWRFTVLYAATIALGFWNGAPEAKAGGIILVIILGVLLGLAWRSTFGSKSDDDAAP
jgi:hypothetical protein